MHRWVRLLLSSMLLSALGLPASAAAPSTPEAMTRRIDELLDQRLAEERVSPAADASDAEFLRRASLDLTGRIPRASEVRQFLADSRIDRRVRLIDRLLDSPTHATHLANTWRRVLLPDTSDFTQFGSDRGFEFWLRQQFVENRPYDALAREVLLAKGPVTQGPTLFYTAHENKPEALAAATSRVFLGLQIECAQCHDHPHDKWQQDEFWGYAAFFARLEPLGIGTTGASLMVAERATGEVQHPVTKQPVAPRYLSASQDVEDRTALRRELLGRWMTSSDNPYFARAAVNRLWALLFGRGLVEPVDDLGDHNPPSHPQLMQELADYFITTQYDVRNLVHVLANTRAYQRTSQLQDGETPGPVELLARMPIKSLTAEQLYDSLQIATCRRDASMEATSELGIAGYDAARVAFLDKFRGPRASVVELHAGIPQSLTLMNGEMVAAATDVDSSDLLKVLTAPFFTQEERIDALFLCVLSRPPHADEKSKFTAYLESRLTDEQRHRALGDMLWALLNTAEFALNH